jgi:hypothetical protein
VGEQGRAHAIPLHTLGPDDPVVLEQAAGGQGLEVLQPIRGQRAIDAVARVENPALRVAE